jgi:hypothetical protein
MSRNVQGRNDQQVEQSHKKMKQPDSIVSHGRTVSLTPPPTSRLTITDSRLPIPD